MFIFEGVEVEKGEFFPFIFPLPSFPYLFFSHPVLPERHVRHRRVDVRPRKLPGVAFHVVKPPAVEADRGAEELEPTCREVIFDI